MQTNNTNTTVLNKGLIAIAIGLTLSSQQSLAVTIDENILITANRSQQEQFLSLSSADIITSDEIKAMQVSSVTDILNTIAGINVVNQGGSGQSSSVFMRGTNSNHSLVLIDGVRVSSATLGSTNFSAMSPSQISRIEVVKGPRAALWGSDAIGGVIQIFTKQHAAGEGAVSVGIGSNGYVQGDAAIGLGNEQHSLTISVSTESSDGFNAYHSDPLNDYDINEDDDDGYDRFSISAVGKSQVTNTLSLHLASRFESGNSEFDASYPDQPCWNDPATACPVYYANEQDHENYSVKLSSQYQGDNIFSEVAIATSQDQGESFGNDTQKSRITTERDQVSFINQYSFTGQSSVNLGLEYYNETVSTSSDLDPWTADFQSWAEDERDVSAVFLQGRHQQGQLLLEAAVRYDDIERLGSETTYNASIGYQPSDDWLVSLNRGTGFKAPTFNDLYWPGSGNPDLKPEEITNTEILVRHQFTDNTLDGSVEVTVFDSEITNLIAWAPNEFGLWFPANINAADIRGVEATVTANFNSIHNTLAIAFVEAEDGDTGKQLLRRPELTATYAIDYHWQDFSFSGMVTYRDESIDSGDAKLDSYVLLDLGVSYQATANLSVNAKVNNLLDEEYETALNYLADGTNYKASITYSF
ncbi:TonB-dependent receptor domain-containing protein [Thalassotalea sp. ND16A]|uniref:TonB-dependent receptor domain-containing protein n=1 Tax=Thalassotalea sp. ND16A TaxID=1535422 RepID=UPI00051D5430|nr:TonB-dependent receptor [Thalassotalea sp. ND16A]KGJ99029.1 hypothetical protein ND16A_0417 [Thalassotalea sp. ND16A]